MIPRAIVKIVIELQSVCDRKMKMCNTEELI